MNVAKSRDSIPSFLLLEKFSADTSAIIKGCLNEFYIENKKDSVFIDGEQIFASDVFENCVIKIAGKYVYMGADKAYYARIITENRFDNKFSGSGYELYISSKQKANTDSKAKLFAGKLVLVFNTDTAVYNIQGVISCPQ